MKPALKPRFRRWLIIVVIAAIALPAGYYLARKQAYPAYKEWREAKLARMAEKFMAEGDYDNALLTARQALRKNQRGLTHWRIAASAAKAKGSADVIYYQRNVAQLEKSVASQLELLRLALRFGAYRDALDTIESINPKATDDPEFHSLAAQTYLALGRGVAAKMHLYSLVGMKPDDTKAKLDLAEVEIAEDSAGANTKLRADVLRLAETPDLRIRSLKLLLKDALTRNDKSRAAELASQLRREPNLESEDQVLVLSGLAANNESAAADYRQQLQKAFVDDPRAVVSLATYYRKAGLESEGRKWFDSLTPEIRQDTRVQEAIAAAYLEWKEWSRLDQAIAGTQWKEREFMRHAFTAYSARKNGRLADAGNAWRLAVIQAGESTRATSELLALVARWGWQSEQYDLVWKLFALMPRNESISRQLIAWEHQQGHTANLNRIYARLAEFSNDDRMLKNNFAYSSLLLDANLTKAYEVARNNFRAEPDNPYYATTQALALYKQNKVEDALALMDKLRPAALSTPERTMLRALFLASSGEPAKAADLLEGVSSRGFLPEERRLMARAASEVARLDRERGQDLRLHAMNTSGEIDSTKGWLKILPEVASDSPTLEMQTADSLYAMGDLRALGTQLRRGSWGPREHLRLALIAYAARTGTETSARSYWRTALGSAAGDPTRLGHLARLAASWGWRPEEIAVTAKLFEMNPSDEKTFNELMSHYRSMGRTADLVNVLTTYLRTKPGDQEQLCELAYYSMLSGLNVSRAYVMAQEAYRAAPDDERRRLVYAFALWKQRRTQEAWDLLDDKPGEHKTLVPAALLRAAVLADMERQDDAEQALKGFDSSQALPEEARLAAAVANKVKSDARVSSAL